MEKPTAVSSPPPPFQHFHEFMQRGGPCGARTYANPWRFLAGGTHLEHSRRASRRKRNVFARRTSRLRRDARQFCHSGNGLPLVSGKNGKTNRPIKKTRHMVTPA